MRGRDDRAEGMFSSIRLEARVPADHPLREVRKLTDEVLAGLDGRIEAMYSAMGRPSIPPEMLLRATLLQAFFSVRSERQLMEQIDYNLLFRWFGGLPIDAVVWHPTVFSHNRDRLMAADVAQEFLAALMGLTQLKALLSSDHFAVDGTLIDAWASMTSFQPKDGCGPPPGPGRNGERDFHGQKRSNETHASTTDPDARLYKKSALQEVGFTRRRLYKKSGGQPSRLCYMGHVLLANRNGLAVEATLTHATGTAEREATLVMIDRRKGRKPITLGADKAYDVTGFGGDLRARNVTAHIAVNGTVSKLGRVRKTAVDEATLCAPGSAISQRYRKPIEEVFGWIKTAAGFASVKLRGKPKVNATFTRAIAADNLIRIPKLLAIAAT